MYWLCFYVEVNKTTMTFLLFLFGIFLALGMFLLTADLLRLPRLATQRAMLSVGRQEKKQARSVEALLMGWAIKLAPHIHMDEYKRGRLKNTLAAAGLNMTPEEYTAFAMVKTGAVLLTVWRRAPLPRSITIPH